MIAELSGNQKEAGKRFETAYKLDPHARCAWSRPTAAGSRAIVRPRTALAVFENFDKQLPRHPLITEAMDKLKAGEKLPPLVATAQAGAAEALYGLGASLGRRGGEDLGLVYLQLALYLAPTHPLALLSLADLYESLKKPELAIKVYERVPANSPLHRNAAIQMASDLDALDKSDEAQKHLTALIKRSSRRSRSDRRRSAMCSAGARSSPNAPTPIPRASPPSSSRTRTTGSSITSAASATSARKQWPKAEADLKKALELYPEQPQVLNYLGYSWIDQGINLDQGMEMIKRAVAQRPDDGYIVNSLGWAYFRLGNYEEAVKQLERAVELKPEDPTINDHLGDAYWRIGRTLEAHFQWAHARDLKPDPEDLPKIEAKLAQRAAGRDLLAGQGRQENRRRRLSRLNIPPLSCRGASGRA